MREMLPRRLCVEKHLQSRCMFKLETFASEQKHVGKQANGKETPMAFAPAPEV